MRVSGVVEVEGPTVSVLIPCYNRAEFVHEAIASVASQTFSSWELIVIDDGSTDRSLEAIREAIESNRIPDDSVRLVSRENKGIVATTIEGFSMARGRYVAFLDADDRWEPEKLEAQVEVLESAGAGTAACFSDSWVVNASGERTGRLGLIHAYRGGDILLDLVLSRFVPPNSTSMFRSEAIRSVGGFDPNSFFQDFPLWLRVAQKYEIRYIDRPLAHYRVHGSNLGRENVDAVFRATLTQIEAVVSSRRDLWKYRRRAIARVRARYAGAFFNDMDLARASREATKALAMYPLDPIAWRILVGSLLGERVVAAVRAARQNRREKGGFRR